MRSASDVRRRFDASGLGVLLVAAVVLLGLTASAPPRRVHAVGAVGVVVRHGDGRVVYAYIPLVSDHITGAEALQGAGFPLNLQASSSLGAAVCKIDGEGCDTPKEDCFCKSYGNPAYYWHYYAQAAGGAWRTASVGAGNRVLHDGDVDGWAWTAGDPNLPAVSLAEIAALVQPAATMSPPMSGGPAPDASPTPARVLPSVLPSSSAPPIAAPPTDAPPALMPAASGSALPASAPPLTPSPAPPARSAATTDAARPTPENATPRAVIVAPGGTITPVQPAPPPPGNGGGRGAFGGFVVVAVVALLLLALVPLGARRGKRNGNGSNGGQR